MRPTSTKPTDTRSWSVCSQATAARIGPASAVALFLAFSVGTSLPGNFREVQAAGPAADDSRKLTTLRRIYLACHGLSWVSITEEDPRRQSPRWEQWPGRCDLIHPLDFEYRLRIYQIISTARQDEGLFVLLDSEEGKKMVAHAHKYFGSRCVVMDGGVPKPLQADFEKGLEEDRRRALECRVEGLTDEQFESEFAAWRRSKTWAVNLREKLRSRGYTFDPATVEFVCWGGDWRGCAATYPIQMGRAWRLANPIQRRWDLIIHDTGPLDVKSTLVVQNVHMADNVRLFVFKNEHGRYCAEYWEGLRCPMERPHVVALEFPPNSVRLVDLFGRTTGPKRSAYYDRTHLGPPSRPSQSRYGRLTVNVGSGGHTFHDPEIIEAGPGLSLDDFYAALVAGKVSEKK